MALMWASPDCTSHSKAKGGKPRERGLRILPWAVYKHTKAILPDKLLDVVTKSDCKIMISGYDNDLYNEILYKWNKVQKRTCAECGVTRIETLWMNYDIQGS